MDYLGKIGWNIRLIQAVADEEELHQQSDIILTIGMFYVGEDLRKVFLSSRAHQNIVDLLLVANKLNQNSSKVIIKYKQPKLDGCRQKSITHEMCDLKLELLVTDLFIL